MRKQSGGWACVRTAEIQAPAAVVWKLLLDVDSYPSTYRTCMQVVRQGKDPKAGGLVRAGSIFEDVRTFCGSRKKKLHRAVTVLEQDPKLFVMATAMWGSTATSSHTLESVKGDTACRLQISYAMVPETVFGKLYMLLFLRQIDRDADYSLTLDLEDLCTAAAVVVQTMNK